ncbi:MAG: hypothetical protein JEZ08_01050 [Clostridiales bacterium]|nr:hypothetical protein [Clostridiales bacterium]
MKRTIVFIILSIIIVSPLNDCFAEELPEFYDLRDEESLTTVKNQGGIGSCWAVSSIASLESFLMKHDKAAYDFSEANLIGETSDVYLEGFDRSFYNGGDHAIAAAYYTSWKGPVLESSHPYPESGDSADYNYGTGEVVKHVQEIIFIDRPKSALENEKLKKYIMTYGAIDVSMWKGSEQTFGPYYDTDNFAWYYPDRTINETGNGHAVNIVGWDDNYEKENFKITPPGDGAYIARNTKGSEWGNLERENAMGGYFYISYYDGMLLEPRDSIVGGSVITRVDDIDNYDHIHQYDSLGYTASLESTKKEIWFSTIFENETLKNEKLAAIGFYTLNSDLDYEIWIKDGYNSIDDFKSMKKIQSGNIAEKGYHTIDLPYDMMLNSNKVAVTVKLLSDSEKPSVAIEAPSGLNSSQAINQSDSFINLSGMWKNSTVYIEDSDVCLKIFTNDNVQISTDYNSVESMKNDVDFTVEWIKTHQPIAKKNGYTSEQIKIIEETYAAIDKPLTDDEFYFVINRLFTMMGDGHTNLYYYFDDKTHVNLPMEWLDEGLVINNTTDVFDIGDKVISIGGYKVETLNKMLYTQISSENDYWVRVKGELYLTYWTFLKEFDLVNGDETVTVEFMRADETKFVRLPKCKYVDFKIEPSKEWYEWHLEKDNDLGYFRFDSWESGEKLEVLKSELKKFFNAVVEAGIQNIAFDIRDNNGGTAQTLNVILSYLPEQVIYAAGNKIYDYYKEYQYDGQVEYDGDIYVMTSNDSYSCSVYATTILKDNGIVKTIGEPTGENPAFNKHGSGSDGNLPEAGWEFMMTSHESVRPLNKDPLIDAIYPDIPAYTTSDDLISGRDPQMEMMRKTANENLAFSKGVVVLEPNKKSYAINLFELNAFSKNFTELWIEDDMFQKIAVTIEDNKIVLPNELDKTGTYYIMMKNNQNKIMGTLIQFSEKEIHENRGVYHWSYSSKFDYVTMDTDAEDVILIKSKFVTFRNSDGEQVQYERFMRGLQSKNTFLFTLKNDLAKGDYTIEIEPGGVYYIDGTQNETKMILELTVD